MDFAPYQDPAPETIRALSPPPYSSRPSLDRGASGLRFPSPLSPVIKPPAVSPFFQPRPGYTDIESGWGRLDEFSTSLPIRLDYEACLAYLLLPPAGGALLLIFEHKSDYVRFHAWQSSLLFTSIFILHLIFSWSPFISWMILIGDIALVGYLTFRAYHDADTLDRCEVPLFGRLASSILEDE